MTGRPRHRGSGQAAHPMVPSRPSPAVHHPQLRHRGVIAEVEHPSLGSVPLPGVTVKLSRTPGSVRLPPPRLGEHTAEVLAEWLQD
ncbi:CoA transferase [Nonomuraea sp. M3C6]|uniref:CoA transferase n=1 Tax=Nonomuraea marmarensis TaxID=3351344 RepID=A0ABW7AFT7_9ACTN